MPRFRFEATDAQGQTVADEIEAFDRAQAADLLIVRQFSNIRLEPVLGRFRNETSPLSDREVTEMLTQLHALTRAGLPLPAGLRAASSELDSPVLRAAFDRLAGHLESGRGLDAALVAESGQFPAHLRGLVLAGSKTGRLADLLAEVIHGSNLSHELRRRIGVALAYPSLVLIVVMALISFVCHMSAQIIDSFTLGQSFGRQPVGSITATYAMTQLIAAYDGWVLLGFVGIALFGFLVWRFALAAPRRQWVLESVPLFGPMIRFTTLAEFCHLTALLVEAQTPLPEALQLAGASVRDASLAQTCGQVAASVAAGQPLPTALQLWTTLPAGLGQLLAWGEEGQSLAATLRFAGDMLEARAGSLATFTSQVVGALLLIVILWWLGFAIAAIYLPVTYAFQMLATLAG